MFFVYILYSPSSDKHYVGQTSDINTRLVQHNLGLSSYTSSSRPWELVCLIQKQTRKEAILLEKKLKNIAGDRLKEFILKNKLNL